MISSPFYLGFSLQPHGKKSAKESKYTCVDVEQFLHKFRVMVCELPTCLAVPTSVDDVYARVRLPAFGLQHSVV